MVQSTDWLRDKTANGEQVRFRDRVRWIRVTSSGSCMFRESFEEDETWKTVNLLPENPRITESQVTTDANRLLET